MFALSKNYLNYWERYYQPDVDFFVIITETTRLSQSSRFSQYLSCLGSLVYPLTKGITRKALSFSTVMVNIWLSFKRSELVDSTHILSISVFVKKNSNNSCGNRVLSKTGAGSFHAFKCCRTELSMCFQLAVCAFSWPKNKEKIRFRTQLRQW